MTISGKKMKGEEYQIRNEFQIQSYKESGEPKSQRKLKRERAPESLSKSRMFPKLSTNDQFGEPQSREGMKRERAPDGVYFKLNSNEQS